MIYIEYPGYFVGWGTLALLNTSLAQMQGRNVLLWFVLSLFFGPIATFFMIITYKR
jgi:hypothetical protein